MSSEVSKYRPEEIVGTGELVVYASDYVELEANCAALEAENARLQSAFDELAERYGKLQTGEDSLLARVVTERDAARAQLAAIQGGMVETIEPCADLNHHERYRAGWNACLAQHQRITAAMAAEVETWRSNALMLEQANVGLAQLNGKLRAELAEVKGWDAVGEVQLRTGGGISLLHVDLTQPLPPGTKLYTAPQPAPAQDVTAVLKMARALSDRQADACNVDREDQWKLYSEDFVADVEAMLAAAHDKQSGGEV